ncbi:hypothetical protein J2X69_000371 [Algoriphagus sp. 4150]|uniref:hypothetical protein n=1 Tax=Algoriphagus sp. 4150 TaxID=2817756 RepID=UPI002860483E|nr:hypothetical protein [Algoriphagus sp. 4150]MDR7128043.1 hypothetical protein [Algoriphagus sp. 4150]
MWLPLPYCLYIAIVHKSFGRCRYQIKNFVYPVKQALDVFIGIEITRKQDPGFNVSQYTSLVLPVLRIGVR